MKSWKKGMFLERTAGIWLSDKIYGKSVDYKNAHQGFNGLLLETDRTLGLVSLPVAGSSTGMAGTVAEIC